MLLPFGDIRLVFPWFSVETINQGPCVRVNRGGCPHSPNSFVTKGMIGSPGQHQFQRSRQGLPFDAASLATSAHVVMLFQCV
jgi:hypothetical protein